MFTVMYTGTLIGIVIAFLLLSFLSGSLEWKVLVPIMFAMFAGNAIATNIYKKQRSESTDVERL